MYRMLLSISSNQRLYFGQEMLTGRMPWLAYYYVYIFNYVTEIIYYKLYWWLFNSLKYITYSFYFLFTKFYVVFSLSISFSYIYTVNVLFFLFEALNSYCSRIYLELTHWIKINKYNLLKRWMCYYVTYNMNNLILKRCT